MKKIMFDDRFGLTQAVLEGCKTMTRRFAEKVLVEDENCDLRWNGQFKPAQYKMGEEVAVAQKYKDLRWPAPQRSDFQEILHSAGWNNKMFVYAGFMPHKIRITSVHIERLQDISEEDCIKEGIGMRNSDVLNYPGPREAFAGLIDKLSGKGTWARNPWVYVYEFELVK